LFNDLSALDPCDEHSDEDGKRGALKESRLLTGGIRPYSERLYNAFAIPTPPTAGHIFYYSLNAIDVVPALANFQSNLTHRRCG